MSGNSEPTPIAAQALAALDIVKEVFGTNLVAVYLHGSAVSGGLRPQSDVDLLVVINQAMSHAARRRLSAALLLVSGRHPAKPGGARPIEMMVLLTNHLLAPAFPAQCEFLYGEWLRSEFEAGEVGRRFSNPGVTLALGQARQEAQPLFGPALPALLAEIPTHDIRRAMAEALPELLNDLKGDERNVLLTLARMWRSAVDGTFVAKDVAAEWAAARAPEPVARVISRARDGYLGRTVDDWEAVQREVRQASDYLREKAMAALL